MATGMADYSSIIRPKFGAAKRGIYSALVGAGVITTLISVSGRGVIYGGHVATLGTGLQRLDTPFLQIDGVDVFGQTFVYLRNQWLTVERGALLSLRRYNDADYKYSVGIGYGFTFESSVKLRYLEAHGRTPSVTGVLHYALI